MATSAARTTGGALVAGRGLSFVVYGDPVPQAELNRNPHGPGLYYPNAKAIKTYRELVHYAARMAMGTARMREPFDGAVQLESTFWLKRPKTVTRALPTVKPDLSHLLRAAEDALVKAGVMRDDALICTSIESKRYCAPGGRPCTVFAVRPILTP